MAIGRLAGGRQRGGLLTCAKGPRPKTWRRMEIWQPIRSVNVPACFTTSVDTVAEPRTFCNHKKTEREISGSREVSGYSCRVISRFGPTPARWRLGGGGPLPDLLAQARPEFRRRHGPQPRPMPCQPRHQNLPWPPLHRSPPRVPPRPPTRGKLSCATRPESREWRWTWPLSRERTQGSQRNPVGAMRDALPRRGRAGRCGYTS